MTETTGTRLAYRPYAALGALLCAGLAGCGGGNGGTSSTGTSAGTASALQAIEDKPVLPAFHLAPLVLDAPADIDRSDAQASANLPPSTQVVPPALRRLATSRLTPERIRQEMEFPGSAAAGADGGSSAANISVFTPAQIRAAYGLAALPGSTAYSAAQAAALGSGQTIYLIDAYSNPSVASDLANFSRTFGLPGCTTAPILALAHLPLAAATPGSACVFSVAYVGSSGALVNTAPAYDAGWATEIAMDVQWAHATAPLARIVLIETGGSSVGQLAAGIRMANLMGPGIVSMSFGAAEGAWMLSYESLFLANGKMSYLASTGDGGAGVAWPSASPSVLAVGGTTLAYTGTGTRSETAWSMTGGGISRIVSAPAYQTAVTAAFDARAGTASHPMRSVADVAFNADPASGQYLIVTRPGTTVPTWYSGGGTSIGTPQWAGLIAVANAQRALAGKPPLGQAQLTLYRTIGAVRGLYAGAFLDVTQGRDGSCSACSAVTGYDTPTGLGTPKAANLLELLAAY
jgi:subtilase family serine protease